MAERDTLMRAVQAARTGDQLAAAVAALDAHDRRRTASLQQSRETDMSATAVRATLEPVPAFEHHTAATDWLGDYEAPSDYRTAMIAEASRWYRGVPRDLMADPDEFQEQALGRAYTAASAYGIHALAARREFMQYVGYLTRSGASGLPQIQQTEDPKDNPAPTPLPEEVFDNFAPPQNEYNTGAESPNGQSQISSEQAPQIQQVQQMDSSGSGFGSGPERPDEHSTSMDTSNSYAEVPLGPPGTIPTDASGNIPSGARLEQGPSSQNPALGQNMDQGSERRPTAARRTAGDSGQVCSHCRSGDCANCGGSGCTCNHPSGPRQGSLSVAAYTRPDQDGFRWHIGSDQDVDTFDTPYHERCGSLHWPEQACSHGNAHTASVAVGYLMNAEDFSRRAHFEAMGSAEGTAVLRTGDLKKVASHHTALTAAFSAEARTEDEIAWLHGYLARVRPVLAGSVPKGFREPEDPADQDGKKKNKGKRKGKKPWDKTGGIPPGSRLDFRLAAEAAAAGDSVPLRICPQCGSTYCKHWQGRDKPYDLPGQPYGMAKDASMRKGAPFAGYEDFDACVAANSDKDDPQAYCGKIKHQVEGARRTAQERPFSTEPGGYHGSSTYNDDSNEDLWQPHVRPHMRPSFRELWQIDPDAGERQPTDDDRRRFEHHVRSNYPQDVADAYFHQHQGASSLPQIQEFTDSHDNPNPGGDQLNPAVMFPLNPAFGGEGDEDEGQPGKQAARRSMSPSMSAVRMFGHLDAMDGNSPHHKDRYPFSNKAHGQYIRGYGETRGVMDGYSDRDPMDKSTFHERTGRGDLHGHYLSAFHEARTRKGGRDAAASAREDLGFSGGTQATSSLRRQADFMTKPHQSTDDANPPFNSAQTTPDEGSGDYSQGMRDGQEDAAAGEHPTFSDNSSVVSPYVKGYSVGYSGRPPDTGTPDVPRSMGGDSGQAQNAADAQRQFQVSHASLQRTAACIGCGHTPHLGQPCGELGCTDQHYEGEMGGGEGSHAIRIPEGWEKDPRSYQVKRKTMWQDHEGSLRVSAAFVTPEATREPDFTKGYKYAARWQPGMLLVRQGSPAFEAGLYAAIADRPSVQKAWAGEHYRLSRKFPVLGARLQAHSSFTVKFAKANPRRYAISASGYLVPVTAGTSVDLITDGPGASPDPMGSTPINGPGNPPPMGGGEDPARSGGPPPYQQAPPPGQGPVAPDDVVGQPQEQPQMGGPFTQTYSGRHPDNQTLAPVAPNTAGGAGYSNTDAQQGDPMHKPQTVAFRRRVQAALAASRAS